MAGARRKASTRSHIRHVRELQMNFIIWLVVGGIIGWIASLIMKTDAQQGLFLNIVVGIVGSLLGGWLIAPLIGGGTVNQGDFSLSGLFVSLVGAGLLLFLVNMIRRRAPRWRGSGLTRAVGPAPDPPRRRVDSACGVRRKNPTRQQYRV